MNSKISNQMLKKIQHIMEQHCKGITKANLHCTRATHLDEHGYCHQHRDQLHHVETPVVAEEPHHNDNNSDIPVAIDLPSLQVLTQCVATSRSTHARCRHLVSFVGETHCPSHGGRQKSPLLPLLPQCLAVARNTRQQCLKPVSVLNETFCPAHGGLTKGASRLLHASPAHAASPPAVAQGPAKSGDASVPWFVVCSNILKYVIVEHPATCIGQASGDASCCHTMQTIRLLMAMAGGAEDDVTSEEAGGATAWANVLSAKDQLNPHSIWLLGMYQLVVTAKRSTQRDADRNVPSPPFRLPSDLDSFLHEFAPSRQDNLQARHVSSPAPSSPPN